MLAEAVNWVHFNSAYTRCYKENICSNYNSQNLSANRRCHGDNDDILYALS